MFVFSVKAGRKKIFIGLAALLLIVTAAIVLTKLHNSKPIASAAGVKYSLSAATNEERVAFLDQFGWKVTTEPVEIKEVQIPVKFDDVYINYNNIQNWAKKNGVKKVGIKELQQYNKDGFNKFMNDYRKNATVNDFWLYPEMY